MSLAAELFMIFCPFVSDSNTLYLLCSSVPSPLILPSSSVDTPSMLHRWSIVSMEYRCTNDGGSYEFGWGNGERNWGLRLVTESKLEGLHLCGEIGKANSQ